MQPHCLCCIPYNCPQPIGSKWTIFHSKRWWENLTWQKLLLGQKCYNYVLFVKLVDVKWTSYNEQVKGHVGSGSECLLKWVRLLVKTMDNLKSTDYCASEIKTKALSDSRMLAQVRLCTYVCIWYIYIYTYTYCLYSGIVIVECTNTISISEHVVFENFWERAGVLVCIFERK